MNFKFLNLKYFLMSLLIMNGYIDIKPIRNLKKIKLLNDRYSFTILAFVHATPQLNIAKAIRKFIENFDIFCVSETFLDEHIVNVQGYHYISQPRKQAYQRKSGGIGIFVKNCLLTHVVKVEATSDYGLCIKVSKLYTGLDEDLLIVAIYIPPDMSKFRNEDELSSLQNDICIFRNTSNSSCLQAI